MKLVPTLPKLNKRAIIIIALLVVSFAFLSFNLASAQAELTEGFFWNILANVIYFFFVTIPVKIASWAGQLFNLSILYFVVTMGQLINTSTGIGFAINEIWEVVRDVMNITFIFALVYLGIKIILSSDDSGTRRAIGLLIAAALLVNFSLLITKTVIDFSNIMAYEIYDIFDGAPTATAPGEASYSGISGAFFSATGMQELVSGSATLSTSDGTSRERFGQLLMVMFMTLIMFIVLTVVFIGGAAMIFVRFIALILYMIFSPVMFLGWVLPAFKKYQDMWWSGFFQKAFFAPAFLFMLYISLVSVTQLRAGLPGAASADYQGVILQNQATGLSIFLVYAFAIGMLVASIIVAQQMGMAGSNATMGALKGAKNKFQLLVGGATFGAGARIGRNTLGWGAKRFGADNEKLKEAASKRGVGGALARSTLKASRVVADSSFDARQVAGAGAIAGIGTGKKGGYQTQREAVIKKEQAFAASLGTVGDDDAAVKMLTEEKIAEQTNLNKLKDQLAGETDPAEKARLSGEIREAQERVKKKDEQIKAEKNRRQTGSVGNIAITPTLQIVQNSKKAELKRLRQDFANVTGADEAEKFKKRQEILEKIKKAEEKLDDVDKQVKEATGSTGYAGVVEGRGFWGSAVGGRIINQNKEAGKAIRKKYQTAVKRSKDDARFDSIKDAVKSSGSK